ncbi:hypothetical protein BGZ83_005023 [Gryganskiella cystojenkinii]|nr:hypothetical protein BGZ83_005023 [Gryganskiella cystojenkinii]
MKFLPLAFLGALFIATSVYADDMDKCLEKENDFEFESVTVNPEYINPVGETCFEIEGKVKKDITSNSEVTFHAEFENKKETWMVNDIYQTMKGVTGLLNRESRLIRICTYLPLSLQSVPADKSIKFTVTAKHNDRNLLCIGGSVSVMSKTT